MSTATKKRDVMDNVHGLIKLTPFASEVINSKIFKRLKDLKQLGNTHEVYPSANHSRFEHCIGVYHLAGKVCDRIRSEDVGKEVTEVDKICVQMAALFHDLGHGPASHLWEQFSEAGWEHENSSVQMIDLIIQEKNIKIEDYGLTDTDLIFIKEMITGKPHQGESGGDGYPYTGRPASKWYLYEIVSSKLTGIDVDKWDYFQRDSRATGVQITFNSIGVQRLLENFDIKKWTSPEWGVDIMRICFRDKEIITIQDMFRDRSKLHLRAYQHKVVKQIDRMMVDAWTAADEAFPKISGKEGKLFSLSEACKDAEALAKLDDGVNQTILYSDDPGLRASRKLLERIANRDLYRIIATISGDLPEKERHYESELSQFSGDLDLVVSKRHIDMGQKRCNPLTKVLIYEKESGATMFPSDEDLAETAPIKIYHENLFVLLRTEDPDASTIEEAVQATKAWTSGREWKIKFNVISDL